MKTFDGVIVYEILPNGCLNGVYSNDHLSTKNEIFNEIARKKSGYVGDEILGVYACSYMDVGNVIVNCILTITDPSSRVSKRANSGQFDFTWYLSGTFNEEKNTGTKIFEGTGWRTKVNQITVSYRDI